MKLVALILRPASDKLLTLFLVLIQVFPKLVAGFIIATKIQEKEKTNPAKNTIILTNESYKNNEGKKKNWSFLTSTMSNKILHLKCVALSFLKRPNDLFQNHSQIAYEW